MTTTTRYRVSEGASDRIPKEKEEENRSESPGIDIADQMVEKAKGLAMKIIILHQECDDICHARRRRSVGVGVGVGVGPDANAKSRHIEALTGIAIMISR